MASITVLFFASLREQAGISQQTVMLDRDTTPEQLFARVCTEHGISIPVGGLRVAVNEQFADWSCRLNAGDRVAFLPPMSGG